MGIVDKVKEGKVDKVLEGDGIKYECCSPAFHKQYILEANKKKSIMEQYQRMFSFYQYGIAEISIDGNYIAYTGCCDEK